MNTTALAVFLAAVNACQPEDFPLPSAWAEQNRILVRGEAAHAGPLRNKRAPYLVGIMDACVGQLQGRHMPIEEVVVMKSAQAGASEAMRSVLGWCAECEPDPYLYVMPDENAAKRIFRDNLAPLFRDTPCLAGLLTGRSRDIQIGDIRLANGFNLRPAWAGSPQTLATAPRRFVLFDEVDKYPPFSGREADPISLGYVRTQTYQTRRLIMIVSTPTTRAGLMFREWQKCPVQLRFRVPCPHCGEYQALSFDRVKWDRLDEPDPRRWAAAIEFGNLAWYECECCGERIEEHHKPDICARGVWATEDQHVKPDGAVEGELPEVKRVGFHLNCLPVLWITWGLAAAEFIRSQSDIGALMSFRNSYLGEVFEDQLSAVKPSAFRAKVLNAPPPAIVPAWAGAVIAGADTQKDHFWYVIRAFGHALEDVDGEERVVKRSQLLEYGRAESFRDLRRICLESRFPIEGDAGHMMAEVMAIDSGGGVRTATGGTRTHEVYEFALSDPARIWAVKGHGGTKAPDRPMRMSKVHYDPGGPKSLEVHLWIVDTGAFKDELAADIAQPAGASGEFLLHAETGADYCRQMSSEQKVLVKEGAGMPRERWIPKTAGAANHLWDAETYCRAAAWQKRVWLWTTHGEHEAAEELHLWDAETYCRAAAWQKRVWLWTTHGEHEAAEELRKTRPRRKPTRLTTPDGREFLVTRR
jgi:phage terminase large subunit GpA-like protein